MTRQDFFKTALGALPVPKVFEAATSQTGTKLFILTFQKWLSPVEREQLVSQLGPFQKEFNCKFLLLHGGVKISELNLESLADKPDVSTHSDPPAVQSTTTGRIPAQQTNQSNLGKSIPNQRRGSSKG